MAIDPSTLNLSDLEQQHGLPSGLLQSVMAAESAGNPNAVSPKGAQGLFQFLPQTAKAYGINPLDPQQAAVGAARMYGDLSKQFDGDVPSMLAAYNWGSGNLTKKGMQNAPQETRDYVNKVQAGMAVPNKQYAQAETGSTTDGTPALPEGFVINKDLPELPEGFVLNKGNAPQVGDARTALDQTMQGATFGYADEAMDAIGALGAGAYMKAFKPELMDGKNVGDLYNEARDNSKERLAQEAENPSAIPLQILGGLITGGAGALTKTGGAVANSLRSGKILGKELGVVGRAIKGAATGAVSGGAYGAGTAEDGNRFAGLEEGATTGAAVGAAIPAAGAALAGTTAGAANIAKGIASRSPEQLQVAGASLKDQASSVYQKFKASGAVLSAPKVQNIVKSVDNSLTSLGKNNKELHRKTLSALDDLKTDANKGRMGLEELDQHRQLFSGIVRDETDITGKISQDGLKAQKAIQAIDRHVNTLKKADVIGGDTSASKLIQDARGLWAKQARFDSVSRIVEKADGDPRKIKTMLSTFVRNKKNLNGFSTEEREALKSASRDSTGEKALNILGKFGIDKNRIMAPLVGGGLTGAALGNPVGATLVAAGTAARQAQKYIAKGKIENALNIIEQRPVGAAALGSGARPQSALARFGSKFDRKVIDTPLKLTIRPDPSKVIPSTTGVP